MLRQVREARLLERSALGYLPRIAGLVALLGIGIGAFVWLGPSWWQLAVAAYLALVVGQLAFLGHDAGHQQIFQSKRWNDRIGLIAGNVGVGLSYAWWVDKHTQHHRHPNDVGRDPDVQRNVLAWTPEQASQQHGPLRLIAKHQAVFFFPLILLEALNLLVGSARALLARPTKHRLESTLLFTHIAGCIVLVLIVLPPLQALAFVGVQQAVLGLYLGLSFAPNHKGMRLVDDRTGLDFLRRQVLTSRNMTGGRALTLAFGGLNYQIEHHLFPSMPSRNLRRCQPLVKAFCLNHEVTYSEAALFDSYRQALQYLHRIRPEPPPIGMTTAALTAK